MADDVDFLERLREYRDNRTHATPEQQAARAERRVSLDKIAANKQLTRRKIIVGGTILKAIESDHVLRLKLSALLNDNLYRLSDVGVVADLMRVDID